MTPKYRINLFWSDEDSAWVADVPDLQSCSAFGDTRTKALTEVEKAMQTWLAVAREDGLFIPKPCYRPHKRSADS